MEDDVFQQGNMLGSPVADDAVDFNVMDDLLLDGWWLEATDCSDFIRPNATSSSCLLDSSCFSPSCYINDRSNLNSPENANRDGMERSVLIDNPHIVETQRKKLVGIESLDENPIKMGDCSAQPECYPADERRNLDEVEMLSPSSSVTTRWWTQPRAKPSPVSSVKERLGQAVKYIDSTRDGDVLVQVWVPIKKEGRQVLTTCDQPYSLDPNSQRLMNYRTVSIKYLFSAEEGSDGAFGLPGRVFLGKLPEWTPDVQYFSSDEYPRVNYAQHYDIHGTIGLPVFERSTRSCLGVLEVVMTSQKINYHSEVENICKALQAVNLSTSEVLNISHVKGGGNSYQLILPEILEVLRAACEKHKLPLAQTWVPCMQQGRVGCRHSDENYGNCVSTLDAACYLTDPFIWGFHEACSEHHLLRGEGVAGKAFTTTQPCFSADISAFSRMQYPLSHYARMFRLRAAVAIRLRSIYTGIADYVLEFFLPVNCIDGGEQKQMLSELSTTIQQVCCSLRVITEKELENELVLPTSETSPSGAMLVKSFPVVDKRSNADGVQREGIPLNEGAEGESPWILNSMQAPQTGESTTHPTSLLWEFQKQDPEGSNICAYEDNQEMTEDDIHGGNASSGKPNSYAGIASEKRRKKTEKTISFQVLRQYFAGSLKDAAKNIGVCPTTLKRICRQHGITRWPSRKIKKVDHSLRKLKVVIDSVQGAEGVFQINSLYSNFPKAHGSNLTSQNPTGSSPISTLKQTDLHSNFSTTQSKGIFGISTPPEKSPSSSCSQTSSSSLTCSTAAHQSSCAAIELHENQSSMLKRANSEAELRTTSKEEHKLPARSQSHKSLSDHPSVGNPASWPKPRENSTVRVKVSCGEEKVRFSLQPSWGFQELQQEIVKRFNIDDTSQIDLKYLDDDYEWVLLTCDADLKECKDIYQSSGAHAMKISVHHVSHLNNRVFRGSGGPS